MFPSYGESTTAASARFQASQISWGTLQWIGTSLISNRANRHGCYALRKQWSDLTAALQLAFTDGELALFLLDASRMHTLRQMIDEFAKVLQFPDYFGGNVNALRDCLADMSWMTAKGYCLVIRGTSQLFVAEQDAIPWFVGFLDQTCREWGDAEYQQRVWLNPSASPFRVIFQFETCERDDVARGIMDLPLMRIQ